MISLPKQVFPRLPTQKQADGGTRDAKLHCKRLSQLSRLAKRDNLDSLRFGQNVATMHLASRLMLCPQFGLESAGMSIIPRDSISCDGISPVIQNCAEV